MKTIALTLLLALQAVVVQAASIAFTNQEYTTSALAGVGSLLEGPFDDIASPSTLPITSSAALTTSGGSATATSTANDFLLLAATDATSISETATAIAVTTFTGDFIASNENLSLLVNFTTLGVGTQLFITLDIGGFTLFDGAFTVAEFINQTISVSPDLAGATGILNLTLTSIADVSDGNTSSNSANVQFSLNSVPEPSVFANLLIGFVLLVVIRFKPGVRVAP